MSDVITQKGNVTTQRTFSEKSNALINGLTA